MDMYIKKKLILIFFYNSNYNLFLTVYSIQ